MGRISKPGSVSVPCLMKIESFKHVHQLVSTVQAILDEKYTCIDAFMACFPPGKKRFLELTGLDSRIFSSSGSMTGAPKYRSTKILEKLEGIPRKIYSGALGFFGLDNAADFSVVIRAAVVNELGELSIGAGGAITILSNPEEEYEEMLVKLHSVLP